MDLFCAHADMSLHLNGITVHFILKERGNKICALMCIV